MKNQIYSNYKKFTNSKEIPANLQTLDQRWEDFVDLLDVYRRRKHHLRSTNRQAVRINSSRQSTPFKLRPMIDKSGFSKPTPKSSGGASPLSMISNDRFAWLKASCNRLKTSLAW